MAKQKSHYLSSKDIASETEVIETTLEQRLKAERLKK